MEGHSITTIPSIADEFGALADVLETVASGIELFAILVLLNGLARFVVAYVASEFGVHGREASRERLNGGRLELSRYILAGLEVFIVSDIVLTVISPTFEELGVLAALVAIRSALSFFLEREMRAMEQEGRR